MCPASDPGRTEDRVTVSIPYFRCGEFIRQAVESVLAQTHSNLRVVVVNDGDEPPWDLLADIDDPRLVRFDLERNHGYYFAHEVILEATGDAYFAVQDADDWSEPHRIQRLLEAMRRSRADGVLSAMWHHIPVCGLEAILARPNRPAARPFTETLEHRASHVGIFKTRMLRQLGGYYGGFLLAYDRLLMNLVLMAGRLAYVDEPLYHYRRWQDSSTVSPATGMESPPRLKEHRQLQGIYSRILPHYERFRAGRIGRPEFRRTIATICGRSFSAQDRAALAAEAARLRQLLRSADSRRAPARVSVASVQIHSPACYRAADVSTFPLDEDHELVYSPGSRGTSVALNSLTLLLSRCQQFQPLGNHVLDCAGDLFDNEAAAGGGADGPGNRLQLVAKAISEMTRLGLLVSETELLQYCRRRDGRETPPAAIASIGIPTRDRAPLLQRGLTSYIEQAKRYGRSPRFVVVDRSRTAAHRQAIRRALSQLRRTHRIELTCAGEPDLLRFAEKLARAADLPEAIVKFALLGRGECPITTGASRNALLLETAGEVCLQVDDDSVCRLLRPPDSEAGLALSSDGDPTEFWSFPDGKAASRSFEIVEQDFLGIHESLLGRDLAAALPPPGGAIDLSRVAAAHDGVLRSGRARVLVTCAGVAGHSGIGSTGYLFLEPASQNRMAASGSQYRASLHSRGILRAARRATLCPDPILMSGNLGLDNRGLLPPFLPVQRGSDAVFSVVLKTCFRHALAGFLPLALAHEPPRARAQGLEDYWRELTGVSLCSVVLQSIRSYPGSVWDADEQESLRKLGQHLRDLGSMSLPDFEEHLRLRIWQSASPILGQIERSLETAEGAPEFLKRNRRKYLHVVRAALTRNEYIIPRDLAALHGPEHARRLSQQIVRQYGELLEAWPDLVRAAQRLRSEGTTLGGST